MPPLGAVQQLDRDSSETSHRSIFPARVALRWSAPRPIWWLLMGLAVIGQACEKRVSGIDREDPGTPAERVAVARRVTQDKPRALVSPKVQTASSFFISPKPAPGRGTRDDPFGLPDLLMAKNAKGPALTILKPGDTLFFLAGTYHVTGSPTEGSELLSPTVSGTASQPITLAAYPGATVNVVETGGLQPVFGTSGSILNYVRFLGFSVDPGPGVIGTLGDPTVKAAFHIYGTGNEVGYCTIIGRYIATVDNHDGIRLDYSHNAWIHHNNIYGVTGKGDNSAGIKMYASTGYLIEDNYIHECNDGIHDKDAPRPDGSNQSIYRRNYITSNRSLAFFGNVQDAQAIYYIYDNVFDGTVHIGYLNTGSQIFNNLVRSTTPFVAADNVWNQFVWNNIVLSGGKPITAYNETRVHFMPSGPKAPLQYMDYNVYDGAASYSFGASTSKSSVFNLSQMKSRGFESHSRVVRRLRSCFRT